jgi:hypothetical protein
MTTQSQKIFVVTSGTNNSSSPKEEAKLNSVATSRKVCSFYYRVCGVTFDLSVHILLKKSYEFLKI